MISVTQLIIAGVACVVLVSAVSGGYIWLDHQISSRDKIITEQQESIAAQKIDIDRLKSSNDSLKLQIATQARSLKESIEQANRIKQADVIERQRQLDFDKSVQTLDIKNQNSLDKINLYTQCVTSNPGSSECIKFLQ